MDQAALEEYKLCVTRQEASQGRIWPMASVMLIFSLGGLPLLGREEVNDWQALALVGGAGAVSIALLWIWRAIDWRDTFWEDLIYQRMWELELRLGFMTNLAIHFVLMDDSDLAQDSHWQSIGEDERTFVTTFRARHGQTPRMRSTFNLIALVGTFAWIGLFAVRLIEFILA